LPQTNHWAPPKRGGRGAAAVETAAAAEAAAGGGYYEVEVAGANREERTLQLYGHAWHALDSHKVSQATTAVQCRYADAEALAAHLAPRVADMPKLASLELRDNDLETLQQVLELAPLCTATVAELTVASQPVCALKLLRPFVAAMFPATLRSFNGAPFSESERALAAKQFGPLSRRLQAKRARLAAAEAAAASPALALALRDEPFGDGWDSDGGGGGGGGGGAVRRDTFSNSSSPEGGSLVTPVPPRRGVAAHAIAAACVRKACADGIATDRRRRCFDKIWPGLIAEFVRETTRSMDDLQALAAESLERLACS